MARLIWTVLCTKTSIDQQTNNMSLFEVIEKLQVGTLTPDAPADALTIVPMQCEVAILWMRSDVVVPETGTGRVMIASPTGQRLEGGTFAIELTGSYIRFRNILRFNGLPVQGSGYYEIVVEYQAAGDGTWTEMSRIPLEVEITRAPVNP